MYLALRGGPRRFTPAFPDPALLGNTFERLIAFDYRAITFCGVAFQTTSSSNQLCNSLEGLSPLLTGPTTPLQHHRQAVSLQRFRLFPFRSPLLRESRLFSLPRGTEMFQFPRFPLSSLCVQDGVTGHDPSRVSPFGHLRIKVCSRLPGDFRSLPRPSSALGAKASTPCPV